MCLIFFFFFFVLTFLIHRIGYLIYDILFAVSFPVSPLKKYIYIYIYKSIPHTFHLYPFCFVSIIVYASNIFRFLISLLISHSSLWFSRISVSLDRNFVHDLVPSRSIARRVVVPSFHRDRFVVRRSSRCRAKSRRVQRGRRSSRNVAGPIQSHWIHDQSR